MISYCKKWASVMPSCSGSKGSLCLLCANRDYEGCYTSAKATLTSPVKSIYIFNNALASLGFNWKKYKICKETLKRLGYIR